MRVIIDQLENKKVNANKAQALAQPIQTMNTVVTDGGFSDIALDNSKSLRTSYTMVFMSEIVTFTRVGQPQVIAKIEDIFTVQITLNGNPDSMWVECYRHPTDYTDNESHPSRTIIRGNKVAFFSIESELEKNVGAMDSYLKQANDCYKNKLVQELALLSKGSGEKRIRQDELDRVNKSIKEF